VSAYAQLLAELAVPRLVGTANHTRVRDVLKRELIARGFVVLEHRFPAAPRFPLRGRGRLRAEGINLIAVRPRTRVATWLAAHYDSKGQPLSMAARLCWVATTALLLAAAAVASVIGLGGLWWWIPSLVLAGGFLVLNEVTDRSPGAVDNASGLVAVLAVLDGLPPESGVGAIFLDAEELGLVGASALARERANLLGDTAVINFDGLDDHGGVVAFMHKPGSVVGAVATRLGASPRGRLPVLVDGIPLARVARECMTIMKGGWGTMRVVHTPGDTPERMTLEGVREVSRAVAASLVHLGGP
jgi:hypothetical protein